MIRRLSGLMAAVVLVASAAIGLSSPPASAAYCTSSGVGVVVEFGDLGGGVSTGCGSGAKASKAFTSAGVTLTEDAQNPGFVCRVNGKPDSGDQCEATNAYWGLFVSKQGGAWTYASQGVYTQPVASGDSVAFVWQDSNSRTPPGTAPQQPVVATSKPTPTATPSAKQSATSVKKPHSTVASKTASATPRATPTTTASASSSTSASVSSSATTTPTSTASVSSAPASAAVTATTDSPSATSSTGDLDATPASATASDSGGLPGWAGPAVIVVIIALAGGVTLWRKQSS
ncbi:hypothetical protein [Nocardioides sp. Kera G14]|uniref:hypothetical protein n=1 Tax=Nocardioides sp. Kera G14 TaxID=2884264 RepID=UPI001D10F5DB|nr:hypothetical protein [Nocardioides sp. Kera G14]UDY24533.1 hypothetical protein LH076_04300 [Nocardioides sp. Kera G14]